MKSNYHHSSAIEDLLGLIELAEKTSEKHSEYRAKFIKIRTSILQLLTSGVVIFAALFIFFIRNEFGAVNFIASDDVFSPIYAMFIVMGMMAIIAMLVTRLKELYEIKGEMLSERRILWQLLEMIDGIKGAVFTHTEIGAVEKALIEMRLSRISFSAKVWTNGPLLSDFRNEPERIIF